MSGDSEAKTKETKGHLHPITHTLNEMVNVMQDMGFEVVSGNEIEDEYHNFDALNIPKDHPARDMQDTFWIKGHSERLLRTHTSGVQIRFMENFVKKLSEAKKSSDSVDINTSHDSAKDFEFKMVAPGKVFRNEATDRTHEIQFFQLEGLAVGPKVSLANLKFTLNNLLKNLFGKEVEIRLRPSYFPFVEPGVEVDMRCYKCEGEGCTTCKKSGWIEILGAGIVHPNVLNAVGIDPNKYSGFAFGIGVDRVAMLKYGIDDIRNMYNADLRLVNQF